MSYYKQRMRDLLTRRAGDWLLHRSWPRTFAVFVMVSQLSFGICYWNLLIQSGVRSVALRTPICMLATYLVHLLITTVWVMLFKPIDAKSLLISGAREIKTSTPGETKFDRELEYQIECQLRQNQNAGIGGFLLKLGVLGCVYIAAHFVYHAPWYLGQMMVDGGKIRHASISRLDSHESLFVSLKQSWPVAMFLILHCTLLAITLDVAK